MTEMEKQVKTHAEKLREAGIKRYGSEEAWRKVLSEGAKKAERHGRGGFHHMKENDPDRLSRLAKEAAKKRWDGNEKA